MIEQHNALKQGASVTIRPFTDGTANMGLEKYEMSLFDGAFHEEQMGCVEMHGIKRYLNGLNEFAPEVKELPEEEREAKVKEIRAIVSQLEKEMASNFVDPEDKDFWNKIKLLAPNNDEFWSKIIMRLSNQPVFLEPSTDLYDLIKLRAIEVGGFSLIAKSLEHARSMPVAPKFYLDKFEETASVKTEVKKLRNKALSELQKLFDKNPNKLLYVCKVIDGNSSQYRKSTPNDIMYDNMDKFINGETVEKDKRKTAQRFTEIAALDMETLKLRSMIKDASFYKLISPRADGHIYHMKSGSLLGKNPSEILEYLKNPLNEDILTELTKTIEKYWTT